MNNQASAGNGDALQGTARLPSDALSLRYWPTWVLVGVLACTGRLPARLRLALGVVTGTVFQLFMRRRREIARRNIDYCLSHLSDVTRRRVLRVQFRELGIALFDSLAAWSAPPAALTDRARIRGLENLHAAAEGGRGVLLFSGHFLPLNMGLQLLSIVVKGHGVYRPHKNPVIDYLVLRGRERQGVRLFPRDDMRTPLRALRAGETVWFSPDQDHGLSHGAFVSFFNRPAATVTTVARLAAHTGARVVPVAYRRLPGVARYELEFLEPLDGFPGDDAVAATRRVNQAIERQVQLAPGQYLWLHRRFKTRPEGAAALYG